MLCSSQKLCIPQHACANLAAYVRHDDGPPPGEIQLPDCCVIKTQISSYISRCCICLLVQMKLMCFLVPLRLAGSRHGVSDDSGTHVTPLCCCVTTAALSSRQVHGTPYCRPAQELGMHGTSMVIGKHSDRTPGACTYHTKDG